jgi:hypothetical protein
VNEPPTRQFRTHRGHRIVAHPLGDTWIAVVHAPGSNAIVETDEPIEGASAQEVMIRGMAVVDAHLKRAAAAS